MEEIFSFKLRSGEEIIAKVVSKPEEADIVKNYVVKRPMTMMLAEVKGGQVMPVPAAPWVLLAQTTDEFPLDADLIMHVNDNVPKMIEDMYIQATTDIQLASV